MRLLAKVHGGEAPGIFLIVKLIFVVVFVWDKRWNLFLWRTSSGTAKDVNIGAKCWQWPMVKQAFLEARQMRSTDPTGQHVLTNIDMPRPSC